ncbi:MAG: amidohydrolase family protein [Planctomycetales bacterium]|nr:amidohydrolase family protein [Planctomycetales bacterium]
MSLTIDSHQHFWQIGRFDYGWMDPPQLEPIRRDRLPQDLKPLIEKVGVDATVFVQTQHNVEENRWVLSLAAQHEFIAGVVGWVDLASERCEEQLLDFKDQPKFVGIRHVTHDEPDVDFIVRPEVLRGLKVLEKHNVPFDLLFFTKHLHHATRLARELPELPMVIDHLAKPEIKLGKRENWIDNFRAAAKFPNLYCKLCGMVTEADWKHWKPADLKPYVETALELFGPERCMYGSDWPVCELAGSYDRVYHALVEALGAISESERAQIFGKTAIDFYGLSALAGDR